LWCTLWVRSEGRSRLVRDRGYPAKDALGLRPDPLCSHDDLPGGILAHEHELPVLVIVKVGVLLAYLDRPSSRLASEVRPRPLARDTFRTRLDTFELAVSSHGEELALGSHSGKTTRPCTLVTSKPRRRNRSQHKGENSDVESGRALRSVLHSTLEGGGGGD
jgi:hypothetical protein